MDLKAKLYANKHSKSNVIENIPIKIFEMRKYHLDQLNLK